MGRAPTFNIELPTDEPTAIDIINTLDPHIPHEITHPYDNDPSGEIHLPEEYDTDDRYSSDKLTWKWLGGHSEYAGNKGEGLIISYTPYFAEDMTTLEPKLEILKDIHTELEEILHDKNINTELSFYAASATI